ncbi:MAG: hypothetical protein QNI95_16685 [Desulfobacterales bacterium]|nr:hypothetical protein [Desulfobacterales bacterium]
MKKLFLTGFTTLFLVCGSMVNLHAQQASQAPAEKKQIDQKKAHKRMLNRAAANSLWRLKRSMEKDGFYASMVALNIWRSTARDAGKFDQQQYDEFRRQIYAKSVSNNLRWFDNFITEENDVDAGTCLRIYEIHAKEIGVFDEARYEEMQQRLKTLKENKQDAVDPTEK